MIKDLSEILILIIALSLGFISCGMLLRFKALGFFFIACAIAWYGAMDNAPTALSIAGFSIYPMDLIASLLMITGILRFFRDKKPVHPYFIFIFLCVFMMLVMLFIGMKYYGLEEAVNNARTYIYFYSLAFYVLSLNFSKQLFSSFLQTWSWASIVLVGVFSTRLLLVFSGFASSLFWGSAGGEHLRVLFAGSALVLFQTLILAWFSRVYGWDMPYKRFLSIVLLPVVIILQHRTVWIIMIVSLGWLLVSEKRIRMIFFNKVFYGSVVFGSIALLLIGNTLVNSLKASSTSSITWVWRLESWKSSIQSFSSSSVANQFFGRPLGMGYLRDLFENSTAVQPHNFYVQNLWDFGILGLLLFLCSYILLFNKLKRSIPDKHVNKALLVLIVGQLLFFITYAPSFEQGVVLGLALNIIGHAKVWEDTKQKGHLNLPRPILLNSSTSKA